MICFFSIQHNTDTKQGGNLCAKELYKTSFIIFGLLTMIKTEIIVVDSMVVFLCRIRNYIQFTRVKLPIFKIISYRLRTATYYF